MYDYPYANGAYYGLPGLLIRDENKYYYGKEVLTL